MTININKITTAATATETSALDIRRTRVNDGTYTPYAIAQALNEVLTTLGRSDLKVMPQPFYGLAKSGKIDGVKWVSGKTYTEDVVEKFIARYIKMLINNGMLKIENNEEKKNTK